MADSHACKILSAKWRSRVPHSACFIFASLLHSLPPLSQHGPYNLMFFRLLATSRRTMSSYFLLGFRHLDTCSLGLNPSGTVYSTSEIVSIGWLSPVLSIPQTTMTTCLHTLFLHLWSRPSCSKWTHKSSKRTYSSSLPYSSPSLLTSMLTKFYMFYFFNIPKICYFLNPQHPVIITTSIFSSAKSLNMSSMLGLIGKCKFDMISSP